ncbi:hypothetical protein K470DRAFT_264383 [Piedraia hortae CBS 480.64]|uniref:VHS domain-containing protein n=1 Tax=Piedraia hortae CBS 480.64 TaxID=1314780 RepID=A0A6A7C031_9PEZI|nr:hypothetical protein K470DRAFT_264383 [Piedraia hortae CBS 480.64]
MFFKKHSKTAVVTQIESMIGPDTPEKDDVQIGILVETIRQQGKKGPKDATRAIRQKLKEDDKHKCIRLLYILDALLSSVGRDYQHYFDSTRLLDRLVCTAMMASDKDVSQTCQKLMLRWSVVHKKKSNLRRFSKLLKRIHPKDCLVELDATRQALR